MKKIYFLLLFVGFAFAGFGQDVLYSQDFETDLTGYSHTPSQTPSSDPGDQYFHRAEPSNGDIYEGSVGPYTNVTNSWLFVGSNPNTINSGSPGELLFSSISISGYDNFELYADFGAVPSDWDEADDLFVEYQIDGGTWNTLFSFAAGGDGTNEPISLTGNASSGINTVNGTTLTYALTTIATNNFSGTGTSMNIKIVCDANANYEAFGVDNIILKGTAFGGGNDTDAEAYTTGSQPGANSISSLDDTYAERVSVFNMYIGDGGDTDGLPTHISKVRIKPHTTNTADWTDHIQGAVLNDGSSDVTATVDITDTYIDFTISSGNLDIADGDFEELTLSIYLNASGLSDGEILSFMVDADNHGFTSDASGTGFMATFSGGDFNSNDFTIDVDATQFTYNQQPSDVSIDVAMNPAVEVAFTDENGNVDADENGGGSTVTMTTTGTFSGSAITSLDASNGVATFSNLKFSTEAIGRTITAADTDGGEISSLESSTFDITNSGDGSMSNPYSCAEAIALSNSGTSDKWVKGYIVGNIVSETNVNIEAPFSSSTNIAIADDVDETNHLNMVYVQLPDNGLREILGLSNVLLNEGVLIILKGDLQAYFGTHIGLKNTDDYKWVADCIVSGSGNWSSSSTWGHGVPGQHDDVIVQTTGALTVDVNGECNTITLKSDASGDASLTGQEKLSFTSTTVERYITPYTGNSDGWHFLSSPVHNMTISGSDFVSGTFDLYRWGETTVADEKWLNYEGGTFGQTEFQNGLGYLFADNTGGVFEFIGSLNSSSYIVGVNGIPLTYTAGEGDGWNLIGNPYCSGLDWTALDNSAGNIGGAFYIVNPADGTYKSSNGAAVSDFPNGHIPPHQGFFVQVSAASSIGIATDDQVHTTNQYEKSSNAFEEVLVVDLVGDNSSNKTYFQFRDDATEEFDFHADAYKLFGWATIPQIYSEIDGIQYSINCLNHSEETITVPLGLYLQENEELTLDFSGMDSFFNTVRINLEDLETGIMTNVRENPSYTFQATTEDNANRFLLHFNGVTAVEELSEENAPQVYAVEDVVYINHAQDLDADIFIYNTNGQLVGQAQMSKESMKRISVNGSTGIYLVTIQSEDVVYTNKVYKK
ncbi:MULTISPECIES: DUF6359 domain-containing protein [unclassified Lentimicrobium]|uniref:DUF6359 domain-containing protein n=1 Tax=unclassified Lentimicrobium TaxID=2677434 RepID=UPI001555D922|nr:MULTISPECIES: DUF6359 domain-containing protein [unclassified Lentimicrobium]NPD44556.1 T9SS type A sorting domain-containing protein [Lentimicrobium sp. S6]NPD85627.1 T9SS type A sorting domain-containing protein [Lentimicrobium sp. L6]